MKIKYVILLMIIFFLCGCQTVKKESIDTIISNLAYQEDSINTSRTGYKYYLPFGLKVKEYNLYNEVFENDNNIFYLYVDLINYYNRVNFDYEINKDAYYSAALKNGDKTGFIEINLKENEQYLIEIMFNYAKIEVIVDEDDINEALEYAVALIRSIKYSDEIIANLLGNDVLSSQEEYDIFDNDNNKKSNYLIAVENDEAEVEEDIKDTDMIN